MTEKSHDKEMDALKADIADLREELAGFTAAIRKSGQVHAKQSHATAHEPDHAPEEEGLGVWMDLLHKFQASKNQSEKVVRDLAAEVEHHPLVSIMAAFGLGYIIAKLWYQEDKQ